MSHLLSRSLILAASLGLLGSAHAQPVLTWAPSANTTLIDGSDDGTRFICQGSTQWVLWQPASGLTPFGSVITSAGSMLGRITADGSTIFMDDNDSSFVNTLNQTSAVVARYDVASGVITRMGPVGAGISGRSNSGWYDVSSDGNHGVAMVWRNAGNTNAWVWENGVGFTMLPQTGTSSYRGSAINSNGTVVGGWEQTNNRAASIWEKVNGVWTQTLAPTALGEVNAISPNGLIRAGWRGSNLTLWDASNVETNRGQPLGNFPIAVTAVQNTGVMAGSVGSVLTGGIRGMISYNMNVNSEFFELRSHVINRGLTLATNQTFTVVNWISADGDQAAGWGTNGTSGRNAFLVTNLLPRARGAASIANFTGSLSSRTLSVEVKSSDGSSTLFTANNVAMDASGIFSVKLNRTFASGTYDVLIRGANTLVKKVDDVVANNNGLLGLAVTLTPGDVNGDNEIDLTDIDLIIAGYLGTDALLDLNGDGEVDLTDIDLAIGNYLLSGDN